MFSLLYVDDCLCCNVKHATLVISHFIFIKFAVSIFPGTPASIILVHRKVLVCGASHPPHKCDEAKLRTLERQN